jgi:hypothetical protein
VTEPNDPPENAAEQAEWLTPAEEQALADALIHAYRPEMLAPELNEALIEAALEDPLRPPSEAELIESERFRRALAGDGEHPDLSLARSLQNAHAAAFPSSDAEQRALSAAESALGQPAPKSIRRPGNVIYIAFGVFSSVVAAAAVALLFAFPASKESPSAARSAAPQAPSFSQSRSSESLFHARFERAATTSRVDRIASVRARELRDNRFKQWGLR